LFLIDDEDYVEDDARQPLAGNEEASEEEEEEEEVEEEEEDEDEEAEEDDDAAEDAVVADSPKSVRKSTDDDLEENESESSSPGDRNQSNANVDLQSSQPNGVAASSNQHDQEDASSSSSSEANADPARGHTVGSSTESGSRANSLRRKGARKRASQEANFRIGVAGADKSAPSTIPAGNRTLGAIVDEDESRRHSRDEDEEAIHAVREAIEKDLLSSSARSGGDSSTPKPDGPTSAASSSRNALQEDGLQSSTTSNRSQSYKSNRVIKTGSPASRPTMYISALRKNSIGSLDDSETSEASQSQSDSVSRHETASDRAKQIDKIRRRMERMRLLGSVDESDQSGALSESSSSESGDDVVTQDQLDDDEEDDEEGTATDVFQSSQADDDDDDADTNSETSASASASASLSTPGESLLSATSKAEQREAELAKLASQISISVRIASSDSGREETAGSMSQRSGSGTNLHAPGTPSGHRRSPSGNVSGPGATSLRSVVASIPSLDHHHFLSAPTPSNAKHIHKKMRKELKLIRSSQLDGIWVNSFEEHVNLLSALISGPVGTPYHLSLHQFDLALSDGYPDDSAPEVFYRSLVAPSLNPMINDDGTLCLSLLTLWSRRGSGDSSRWWNPDQANLMQVLLSIQGLLFGVQFPIFLQQPRLQQHKSKETQRLAMLYNERILLLSLQHIYRMLYSPPSQFEALIRDFYRANRDGLTRLADLLQPLARSRKQTNANSNKELLAFASSEIPAANAHVRHFGISYDPPPTQGFLVVFDKLMNKLKPLLVDL
jgi:ubiquitin-protein ligase